MSSIYILGISAYYHDSAAALLLNGEVIAAAQQERFTRKKHDERFPAEAIQYCLDEAGIKLTDVAAAKVSALLAQEGRDDLYLRVAVQPGGCSGLRYQLYFDDRNQEGDITREFGAVKVVVDKMSDPYLMGATVDFVDTIEKQGFTIDNPNAGGSCACGDSFN